MDDGWTKNFSKKNKEKKAKDLPIFVTLNSTERFRRRRRRRRRFLERKINNRLSLLRGLEILRRALYLSLAL
jgi:hypothetical protein|tara:strand:+ start:575 stop:790 length:216 start_codon:yes stop_codon:yes gene_type:complete